MSEVNVNESKARKICDEDLRLCFTKDIHMESIEGIECQPETWRMKERMKTVSVALVLCLNVGVDPPDVVKTQPCARLECWVDPLAIPAQKALEKVGAELQKQYERWQPRARYKQSLDPTAEEIKKLCTSLRRNSKEERVLFHYNGHGVPKPTSNGEIWVFNRTYTQYIPLSIYDLQTWMGSPSIYVYDCSNAGIIIESFKTFAAQHENEYEQSLSQSSSQIPIGYQLPPNYHNCIQLAACSSNQVLPMNPDLPADLFTSCLTTPIKIAIKWFVLKSTSKLNNKLDTELIDLIPGQYTDRRTMLGELNWIFTAITDTIAWNTLDRDLFQRLFRQDLLVASLFRNFLLAERILKSCDCTPVSSPLLPSTYQHPLWEAWDLALELCLNQLPNIIKYNKEFCHLPFFEEQLTSFQVWLDIHYNNLKSTTTTTTTTRIIPPEQLPIVLQVLLSQVHRVRALELLGRFLDLGPWAVNLALSVGIFPYVLKLLQSCAKELRPLLVHIWAKILAVDNTCQTDLVKDNGHKYFLAILQDTTLPSEYRVESAFILAQIVNNYHEGQEAALQGSLVSTCLEQLNDTNPKLRQWMAICLGRLWDHYEKARWTGVRDIAHEKLYNLLYDKNSEVRASAVFALGTFINSVNERSEHANNIDNSIIMTLIKVINNDISIVVRKELLNVIQWIILAFEHVFVSFVLRESQDLKIKRVSSTNSINQKSTTNLSNLPGLNYGSIYMKIWKCLLNMEFDPFYEIAEMAQKITNYIRFLVQEHIDFNNDNSKSSISLPPSPNRSSYLTNDSSLNIHTTTNTLLSSKFKGKKITPPSHYSIITEESDNSNNLSNDSINTKCNYRKALVSTKFIEWTCKEFAQKMGKGCGDFESKWFYDKDWRCARNNNMRREAYEEQKKALSSKLESQVFNTRTSLPPTIILFHPYDQQIAIAGKDQFGIWDWGTGAKTTTCHNKSTKYPTTSRITSLEWINSHDLGMIIVGSDDGCVKLWKPNRGYTRDPKLITAWQAFNDNNIITKNNSFLYNNNNNNNNIKNKCNCILKWEQLTQTLITVGDSKLIRLWDCEKELHSYDLLSGTESSITCIDTSYTNVDSEKLNSNKCDLLSNLILIGCNDGSIRLFDRRCSPNDAKIGIWMEQYDTIINVQLKNNTFISGCANGDVKIYDIRKNDCIHSLQAMTDMSCFAVHRNASIYACGSLNNNVSLYTINGYLLNTIKFYEGFMGHRTGPVTCLNYHPYKLALGIGTSDCSIAIYALDGRR